MPEASICARNLLRCFGPCEPFHIPSLWPLLGCLAMQLLLLATLCDIVLLNKNSVIHVRPPRFSAAATQSLSKCTQFLFCRSHPSLLTIQVIGDTSHLVCLYLWLDSNMISSEISELKLQKRTYQVCSSLLGPFMIFCFFHRLRFPHSHKFTFTHFIHSRPCLNRMLVINV